MLPLSIKAASMVVRSAVDIENISVKSVVANHGTRTGEFMKVDLYSSWIELDQAISNESRAFILTPSNIKRIKMVAKRMEARSFDKISGPQLRKDLRELAQDLYSSYTSRRVKDRKHCLSVEKVDAVSVKREFNTLQGCTVRKSILDTNIEYTAHALEENEDEDVSPDHRDVDAMLLRCDHICESVAAHPDLSQDDRDLIMNPTTRGWMESLRRRRTDLLHSMTKNDHTGLCYDLDTFMTVVDDFMDLVVRERNLSIEITESRERDLEAIRESAGVRENKAECKCVIS